MATPSQGGELGLRLQGGFFIYRNALSPIPRIAIGLEQVGIPVTACRLNVRWADDDNRSAWKSRRV
ncbi:hypothetical protein OOK60_13020 [Trichothermofontia sichuanensis B231]|uniref:hypothetical protein n=1 Tax=Trichothermofontia sichuanensis TaxID=3045816 RepID=UPI002247DC82|nr:hypothetical protein [Trichothermofontia sichuanensis]UZQ53420.1 hypothetical protein OOK60_13020 [Trichothermofontia sichuanensis B231]